MSEPVVNLQGVSRSFGNVVALADFDLRVEPGTVTALLGPNGAGKTTTVRVITGGLRVDGSVRVFGMNPYRDGERVRARCGVVSAKPALYDRLNGYDNLLYAARLFGIGDDDGRIRKSAARFGIDHALKLKVGTYSTGMKTRLALARAILHDPELLLLDEPTAGLDPESSRAVLHLIHELARSGKTVVLCTHLLLEAEGLADRIVIMDRGHTIVSGPPGDLSKNYWPDNLVLIDAQDRAGLEIAKTFKGVSGFEQNGHAMVQIDSFDRVPDLIAFMTKKGVRLTRVEPRIPTLEELYFHARRGR